MPFDGATFNGRGSPSPRHSGSWLLESLKETALAFAFVMFTFLACGLAGTLVEGSYDPTPLQAGSVMGQIAGTGAFLVLNSGFVLWRVRRLMAQ